MNKLIACLAALLLTPAASAATLTAIPATLGAQLTAAKPGDTITLAPGDYGRVSFKGRRYAAPGITVQAKGTRLLPSIINAAGITLDGALADGAAGAGPLGYAAHVQGSERIALVNVMFRNATRGLVIDRSRDVVVSRATLAGLRSDGINIALSQRVNIRGATCRAFSPAPGDHPDCVQGWSRPGGITQDVVVSGVDAEGQMQGIFFGNHVRAGVDDGGFDRIKVIGNRINVAFPQGIAVSACRGCFVANNQVTTLPGAKYRASINVQAGIPQAANTVGPKR